MYKNTVCFASQGSLQLSDVNGKLILPAKVPTLSKKTQVRGLQWWKPQLWWVHWWKP